MKIIILGAGRVGESVADSLVSERNDITVIDTDAERLRDLESRFDLRGVVSVDGDGVIQDFNASAERIFGWRRSEIIGRNVAVLVADPLQS
eukprot:gene3328-4287_t